MLKCIIILIIGFISYAQAFSCEFGCPENAECIGENKCTCNYGYKNIIADTDGMPHCQLQGTTTITPNSRLASNKLQVSTSLTRTIPSRLPDYKYLETSSINSKLASNKFPGEPSLAKAIPTKIPDYDSLGTSSISSRLTSNKLSAETSLAKAIPTRIPDYDSLETSSISSRLTSNKLSAETSLTKAIPTRIPDYDSLETSSISSRLTSNKLPGETSLARTVPTRIPIFETRSTDFNTESDTTLLFAIPPSVPTDTKIFKTSTETVAETEDDIFSTKTTQEFEEETSTINIIFEDHITTIKENSNYENNNFLGKTALEKFYIFLGIFCILVAFLFLLTILFGCAKL